MKFRKKPVVIEAVRYDGWNMVELVSFAGAKISVARSANRPVWIDTDEGTMRASVGDWIIKGIKGEFYPCKPDVFQATYEPAE